MPIGPPPDITKCLIVIVIYSGNKNYHEKNQYIPVYDVYLWSYNKSHDPLSGSYDWQFYTEEQNRIIELDYLSLKLMSNINNKYIVKFNLKTHNHIQISLTDKKI